MFALILAVVTATSPAPSATPLATAEELYEGAIARLAALKQAPFLSYEMDQTGYTREQGIIFDTGQNVIERRADRAFHNVMLYGGTGLLIGRHYLTPDEFIPDVTPSLLDGADPMLDTPAPAASPAPGVPTNATPKTIATVSTTASYALTYDSDMIINNNFCGEAAHIKLVPKRDSSVYNVRELWIRRSDFALCAAIFNSFSFSGEGRIPSVDAVWLDERGFIVNWRCEFQVGNFDQGSFKNVTWEDKVAPGLYFSH